jgi:hypothetical protein
MAAASSSPAVPARVPGAAGLVFSLSSPRCTAHLHQAVWGRFVGLQCIVDCACASSGQCCGSGGPLGALVHEVERRAPGITMGTLWCCVPVRAARVLTGMRRDDGWREMRDCETHRGTQCVVFCTKAAFELAKKVRCSASK